MPSTLKAEVGAPARAGHDAALARGASERRARLACEESDPEAWFTPETREWAKLQCSRCPARAACLQLALQRRETHGVWGGLDERERRRLERAQVRPAGKRTIGGHRPATVAGVAGNVDADELVPA